jgi:hypothetical protein
MKYSQRELLDEGFWDLHTSPILKGIGRASKIASGAVMGATKGIARTLDYVAPEVTQPMHRLEAGIRDIAGQTRKGFDVGYGGLSKEYGDILLDAGYLMDKNAPIIDTGKNKIAVGYRIIGQTKTKPPQPIPDTRKLSFLFDHNGNFKIVTSSAQDTSRMNETKPFKYKKHKTIKR